MEMVLKWRMDSPSRELVGQYHHPEPPKAPRSGPRGNYGPGRAVGGGGSPCSAPNLWSQLQRHHSATEKSKWTSHISQRDNGQWTSFLFEVVSWARLVIYRQKILRLFSISALFTSTFFFESKMKKSLYIFFSGNDQARPRHHLQQK